MTLALKSFSLQLFISAFNFKSHWEPCSDINKWMTSPNKWHHHTNDITKHVTSLNEWYGRIWDIQKQTAVWIKYVHFVQFVSTAISDRKWTKHYLTLLMSFIAMSHLSSCHPRCLVVNTTRFNTNNNISSIRQITCSWFMFNLTTKHHVVSIITVFIKNN